MGGWLDKILGALGGGSGGGGLMSGIGGSSQFDPQGLMGNGKGMDMSSMENQGVMNPMAGNGANPNQGAIDAQKYKNFMNMMNSPAMQQSRGQHAASSSDDKAFALTEGQRSYQDMLIPPATMQGLAGMVNSLGQQPQPFRRGLNGYGFLQELLNNDKQNGY